MPHSVGVLFGGPSAEYDVSLRSAAAVISALRAYGCEVYPIHVTKNERFFLLKDFGLTEDALLKALPLSMAAGGFETEDGTRLVPDCLFPVIHGDFGEDGRLQSLLDGVGLPYVGCREDASRLAIDKAKTKDRVARFGVPVLPHVLLSSPDFEKAASCLGLPFFIKPVSGGSSFGAGVVKNKTDFDTRFRDAIRYSPRVICEPYILKGREIEAAVMETAPDALVADIGEVIPSEAFYSYYDKYEKGKARLSLLEDFSKETRRLITEMAKTAFRAVGCRGLSRVDFFLTEDGHLYLNEINTLPGMTENSLYPRLMEKALGVSRPALFYRLSEGAFLP